MTLDDEDIQRIADRVCRLLGVRERSVAPKHAFAVEQQASQPTPELVDAATVASLLAVERSWVYAHAEWLGGIRLGEGPRGRLRFDPRIARDRLADHEPPVGPTTPTKPPVRRRRRRGCSRPELLATRSRQTCEVSGPDAATPSPPEQV